MPKQSEHLNLPDTRNPGQATPSHYINITIPTSYAFQTRSTSDGGRGCNNFVPVLRGNGTKIAPTEDIFDQPPGGISWIRGKLANHVGDHVVISPEEGVLVSSPGTASSYSRLPQLLNNSPLLYLRLDNAEQKHIYIYFSSHRTPFPHETNTVIVHHTYTESYCLKHCPPRYTVHILRLIGYLIGN